MRIKFPRFFRLGAILLLAACQAAPAAYPATPGQPAAAAIASQPAAELPPAVTAAAGHTSGPAPAAAPPQIIYLEQGTATAASQPLPTATILPSPETPLTTTLLFVGVIVPARCVQASLDKLG